MRQVLIGKSSRVKSPTGTVLELSSAVNVTFSELEFTEILFRQVPVNAGMMFRLPYYLGKLSVQLIATSVEGESIKALYKSEGALVIPADHVLLEAVLYEEVKYVKVDAPNGLSANGVAVFSSEAQMEAAGLSVGRAPKKRTRKVKT